MIDDGIGVLAESDTVVFEAHDFRDKMSLVISRDSPQGGICLYFNLKLRQFRSFKSKLAVVKEYLFNNREYISQELILTSGEIKNLRDKLNVFLEQRDERVRARQNDGN
jgi:hypothetical protein